MSRRFCLSGCLLLMAACGGTEPEQPGLTAGTLGPQSLLGTDEYRSLPPWDTADVAKGENLSKICRTCHSLGEGEAHMMGPNLYGFFGRQAGSIKGYDFSQTLAEAEFYWTPRALNAWLANPVGFAPGNRMSFAGIGNAQKRAELIAYLLEATAAE